MPVTPTCQLLGPKTEHWQAQFRHSMMNLHNLEFLNEDFGHYLWYDFLKLNLKITNLAP